MKCGICGSSGGGNLYSIPREHGTDAIKKQYPTVTVCPRHYKEYCENHPDYRVKISALRIERLKRDMAILHSQDYIKRKTQDIQGWMR